MKIIIIGAVAAGTSAAAKARRNDDKAQIKIFDKDTFISYSGCGMPYYIGGEIEEFDTLSPRDPAFFKKKYDIDVFIGHEVLEINKDNKTLTVKNLSTGENFTESYDKLVLATGATAFKPNIDGIHKENVFFMRNMNDTAKIKNFITLNKPKSAVIAGTGFIGLEMAENLKNLGLDVKIVEVASKITPNLDEDMAKLLENKLTKYDIEVLKDTKILKISDNKVELSTGNQLDADIVILATGVRPNTTLAQSMGIELGVSGAIKVNKKMQTNIADVYACGDCIETFSSINEAPVYRPLGSTANKTGRIAGDSLSGGSLEYKGNLSTGIFKVFDLAVASTGLSQSEAIKQGFNVEVCHNIKPNKPEYMGGKEMIIKAIADKDTGRLLGVQIVGNEGVDKRIDVFATLITYKATVDELFHIDLAYAPPFSTTKDPVHYTGMILDNAISQNRPLITSNNLKDLGDDVQLIDARSNDDYTKKGTVENAVNIPHAKLRDGLKDLDKSKPTVTFCNKGVTGNAAQNILIGNGFEKVYNLSGGHKFYKESK